MKNNLIYLVALITLFFYFTSCSANAEEKKTVEEEVESKTTLIKKQVANTIICAADRPEEYLKLLENKKVALLVNHTAQAGGKHLLDFLLENKIEVTKVFAPEHGFRGDIDRGDHFSSDIDKKTGIPIIAMFGKNRKPKLSQLQDVDVVIFDIQDVGVRFFTYISSMHNMMEACAETNKKMIVFDRPNPLGDYIDGPVRKAKFKSFVGMHPIPVVHGLTVGELANMINGEGWLKDKIKCDLTVIPVKNYTHSMLYKLPLKPSPNLPNMASIRLYPALCFFEATEVSIGRGTSFPFQTVAYPDEKFGEFTFVPKDIKGMQNNPIQEGKTCYGINLQEINPDSVKFSLQYIINCASKFPQPQNMITRNNWFNLLAGNKELQAQIIAGKSEKEIKKSWEAELETYKTMRAKYLLYEDF